MRRWYILFAVVAVTSALTMLPTKTRNCIDNCKCKQNNLPSRLQVLECNRPLIINETTFRYFKKPQINTISLENVNIEQIQETAFGDFKNLEDVLIINSKIGSIDAKAFNKVKRLKFANCGFEDSPDLFSEKLEELHFGSCQIEEIPKLNGLLSLTFLNLTGNYIKDVGIETFAELFDLEQLYLSNNEIFKLPPTLFINNRELNSLYLDNNPLRQFYLNTSENLETLSLKNCQLETFDERSTQRLSTLNELNLSNNKIKTLSGNALAHMKDLSVINLSNNKLEKLDDDIFSGNPNLVKITLDSNNLGTLPNFYLKNGGIFSTYTFSYNIFEKIPSLKILDISYNNIPYISPTAFAENRDLEVLNIAGNPLMVLNPEVFSKNHVIKDVDARNTSLQKLWSNNNTPIKSLHKLLVGDNNLTTITIDDLKIMPNLKAIDLNNNKLIFSEKLCYVINWLDRSEVSPIEYTKNIDTDIDAPYYDNSDGFSFMSWKEFYNEKCPEIIEDFVTTPESFKSDDDVEDEHESENETSNEYHEDEYDDYNYDDETDADEAALNKYVQNENNNLAKASYILSVTSVFILTALVVLTLAVTITLTILRRNSNFNMHKANLPRLKIPLWYNTPGQKKHSGSVYRPLSEDLSGPKTPKLSRYEFTSTPTVHSSNP
ncbi:hypothetical protein NQ314_010804 [Rhamnusium bicolor]|uniref:Uncharacterized protein n=1 Tax=Rhamnusium bicolor TaxID=1586634 RepID=A0AAV8XNG1_9CUCU|nr:hypothetical protein NQ314_010804 [Rhamnusium bicolor]